MEAHTVRIDLTGNAVTTNTERDYLAVDRNGHVWEILHCDPCRDSGVLCDACWTYAGDLSDVLPDTFGGVATVRVCRWESVPVRVCVDCLADLRDPWQRDESRLLKPCDTLGSGIGGCVQCGEYGHGRYLTYAQRVQA